MNHAQGALARIDQLLGNALTRVIVANSNNKLASLRSASHEFSNCAQVTEAVRRTSLESGIVIENTRQCVARNPGAEEGLNDFASKTTAPDEVNRPGTHWAR
jgi:hypothetical protein